MGKKSGTESDWDDDGLLDGDDVESALLVDTPSNPAPRGRLTWRLIEQAREARALREQLADFSDYV
jgi:hypothetical protein